MPPRKFEEKDAVFAVSQAIIAVLRHSTNRAFVTASLDHLEANTLQEAEQRLGQHLWSILHRHQGANIPPEVAEEISSLPLPQHTQTTTDFQDFPEHEDSTLELWHNDLSPVVFREEELDELLSFSIFDDEGSLDAAEHTMELSTHASPASDFCHGLSLQEGTSRIQPMQNLWHVPGRSSTPIPLPHPGARSDITASCQVYGGTTAASEQMANTLMTPNFCDEPEIFEGSAAQERSDSHLYQGIADKDTGNVFTSRTGEPALPDSSLLPSVHDSLEKTWLPQALPCDKAITPGPDSERTTRKDRSKDVCQANPPQDAVRCVRSQPSSPENPSQKSKGPDLAEDQGICDTADSSHESVILLCDTDDPGPARDLELNLLPDLPSFDEIHESQDSISILYDSDIPWPGSDELVIIDVSYSDFYDAMGTEQIDTTDEPGAENNDTQTENEAPRTQCGNSTHSGEAEVRVIYETITLPVEPALRNSSINRSWSSELPDYREDEDYSKDDTESPHSEPSTKNVTSSELPRDISNTSKSDLAVDIFSSEISQQRQNICDANRGEQIRSNRIAHADSRANTMSACTDCPSQQHSSLPSASKDGPSPLSAQNDHSVFLDHPLTDIVSSGEEQTQDYERYRLTLSFSLPDDKSTHPSVTKKTLLAQETHPDIPAMRQVPQLPEALVLSEPKRRDNNLAQKFHPKHISSKPAEKAVFIPMQPSADPTGHGERLLQPLPEQVSPEPNASDEGVIKLSQEQMLAVPSGLSQENSQPLHKQVSLYSDGSKEGMSQLLPQELTEKLNASEEDTIGFLSGQILPYPDRNNNTVLLSLNELPPTYPKNRSLIPQCNQLLPQLQDNDEAGPGTSSSLASTGSNESDQTDNSESLLKGMTYDPVSAALSSEFPNEPASETCDPTHQQQIMGTLLPVVSKHQDTDPQTHSKNHQTQNKCVYKPVNSAVATDTEIPSDNAPSTRRHRVRTLRSEDLASEVHNPNKPDETTVFSPSINRADEDTLPFAAEELPTVHEGKSLTVISGQDPVQRERSCDPQGTIPKSTHSLVRYTPQCKTQDLKVHETEVKEVSIPGNKLTKLPEVEDDPRKLSGNKLREVMATENALEEARVPQDEISKVIQPESASNKPSVLEITTPDDASRFVRDNLLQLQRQDTDYSIVSKEGNTITDDKMSREVTTPFDDLWKENIPEIAMSDDDIKRFALPHVTTRGSVHGGSMPHATVPKDSADDRTPNIEMLEATDVRDSSIEGMVLDEDQPSTYSERPGHSPMVTNAQQVSAGQPGDFSIIYDSSEEMIIEYESLNKQVPAESDPFDVTMLVASSEMITESEAANKRVPAERFSADVTMIDLDYDSDDFIW